MTSSNSNLNMDTENKKAPTREQMTRRPYYI